MAVSIKSAREIELMREAGKRLAHVHQELEAMISFLRCIFCRMQTGTETSPSCPRPNPDRLLCRQPFSHLKILYNSEPSSGIRSALRFPAVH
jgi:hypothetical protein